MNQSKPPVKSPVPLIYTGGSLTVVLNGKSAFFAKDALGSTAWPVKGGAALDDILDYINGDLV